MLTLLILFLAIALGFIAVMVIIGWVSPWGWSLAGLITGVMYFTYLEAWANYDKYMLEPALEVLMGTRVPGVWEYVAIYSLVVLLFMIGSWIYNIYYSFYNEGLIRPFYERAK